MAVTPPLFKSHKIWLLAAALATQGSLAQAQQPQRPGKSTPPPEEVLWTCNIVSDTGEWVCDYAQEELPEPAKAEEPVAADDSLDNRATLPVITPHSLSQPAETGPAELSDEQRMAPIEPADDIEPPQNAYQNDVVSKLARESDPTGYLRDYPWMFAHAPQFRRSRKWDCFAEDGDWVCRERVQKVHAQSLIDPQTYQFAYLDWYPNPDGVDAKTHCSGEYVEPFFSQPEGFQPGVEPPLLIEAETAEAKLGEVTRLQGVVRLMQGQRHLHSDYAELDQRNNLATLSNRVLYREPGLLMLGDSATVNTETRDTRLQQAKFVMHGTHLRGDAEQLDRTNDGRININRGSFTRCEPGNNSWIVSGSEIELRPDTGFGSAKHATLRVGGVPVFYVPYIYFPIDDRRQSGFLVPSISVTEDNGLDIAAPYYFNIAPNIDDTFTPRIIRKRGLMLENELRYLNRRGSYSLSTAVLPSDDVTGDDRWLLGLDHRGSLLKGWSTYVDFTAVSDDDYFDDLDTTELSITKETHLERFATIRRQEQYWAMTAELHGYQTIDQASSSPYSKLPEVKFWGQIPQSTGLNIDYRTEYAFFDRDPDDFTGLDRLTGQRVHVESSLGYPIVSPGAYLRPKLRLMHTQYGLDNQLAGNRSNIGRSLPIASVDTGLIFERAADKGRTQTLEPRLFYLYVPEEDQSDLPTFDSSELTFGYSQLFRDNRFSGLDRIGDTHQLTAAVSTRVYEPNGREKLRMSLGQIFYFEDREVTLQPGSSVDIEERSDLAGEMLWQLSRHLRFTADALWDHSSYESEKRNLKFSYRSDMDHVLNLGYRFTEDELEQTDISAIWPINNQWSFLGRWLRDTRRHENLEEVLGLEYESCCWKTRLVRRVWIDDDLSDRSNEGIFLQVTLKGLGTTGTGAGALSTADFLSDITGFDKRESL